MQEELPGGRLEFELKLAVPREAREALRRAFLLPRTKPRMVRLQARYFDTPDRALASAGMALRVRREGRRWVQTLKTTGAGEVGRQEFETARPDASLDLAALSATPAAGVLGAALQPSTQVLELRFETAIRRWVRLQRVRGGVVELAFDEGRILAGERSIEVCELEIELVRGSRQVVFDVARRWQKRFGLVLDARSKAERGNLLAMGEEVPAPTRAAAVRLGRGADAAGAFSVCVRSCVGQIERNASALALAGGSDEHVHQLRVGIRRLRSLWRFFDGWIPVIPEHRAAEARALFCALGAHRDFAVLTGEVEPRILAAGMPEAVLAHAEQPVPRAAEIVRAPQAQAWLLEIVESVECPLAADPQGDPAGRFKPLAVKRLRHWHDRLIAPSEEFGRLDAARRHALRKRAKRLRYALEFSASLFESKRLRRYLRRLSALQSVLGELNDLAIARSAYASRGDAPAAWYARGWIAARCSSLEAEADAALAELRDCEMPWR